MYIYIHPQFCITFPFLSQTHTHTHISTLCANREAPPLIPIYERRAKDRVMLADSDHHPTKRITASGRENTMAHSVWMQKNVYTQQGMKRRTIHFRRPNTYIDLKVRFISIKCREKRCDSVHRRKQLLSLCSACLNAVLPQRRTSDARCASTKTRSNTINIRPI